MSVDDRDRVVLITGVSGDLGRRIAARLSRDPSIRRLIGVDVAPPSPDLPDRVEFVRADIRNPLIAKVLEQAQVDTVVHPPQARSRRREARVTVRNDHVAGTVQLLAGCERAESVRRVVACSTTAVYGASCHDPAVFTEQMTSVTDLGPGPARVAVEVENKIRAFARTRPDVVISVLRFADLIGPTTHSWLTRYLALPIVPVAFGRDPRLQLLHESDAIEVVQRAVSGMHPGVTNVAAEGVLTLSQVVRCASRLRAQVPGLVIGAIRSALRSRVTAEDAALLTFGRVVDTERLTTELGYLPRYTSLEALRTYLGAQSWLASLTSVALDRVHRQPAGLA